MHKACRIYLFIYYDTFIKSFLSRFFFCANYCVIVTTNFSRCCGWLRFVTQPKLLFFYSGHPGVCTATIIIIKAYPIQRLGNRGWANVGGNPWHHQEGHVKLLQQNPWQHQHTWTSENNSPFYSPPSQAGPLHQVETLFAFFGLGCWERKTIAITLVYLV